MALPRDFKETIQARVQRDAAKRTQISENVYGYR